MLVWLKSSTPVAEPEQIESCCKLLSRLSNFVSKVFFVQVFEELLCWSGPVEYDPSLGCGELLLPWWGCDRVTWTEPGCTRRGLLGELDPPVTHVVLSAAPTPRSS